MHTDHSNRFALWKSTTLNAIANYYTYGILARFSFNQAEFTKISLSPLSFPGRFQCFHETLFRIHSCSYITKIDGFTLQLNSSQTRQNFIPVHIAEVKHISAIGRQDVVPEELIDEDDLAVTPLPASVMPLTRFPAVVMMRDHVHGLVTRLRRCVLDRGAGRVQLGHLSGRTLRTVKQSDVVRRCCRRRSGWSTPAIGDLVGLQHHQVTVLQYKPSAVLNRTTLNHEGIMQGLRSLLKKSSNLTQHHGLCLWESNRDKKILCQKGASRISHLELWPQHQQVTAPQYQPFEVSNTVKSLKALLVICR